jgi:hypothetical protein
LFGGEGWFGGDDDDADDDDAAGDDSDDAGAAGFASEDVSGLYSDAEGVAGGCGVRFGDVGGIEWVDGNGWIDGSPTYGVELLRLAMRGAWIPEWFYDVYLNIFSDARIFLLDFLHLCILNSRELWDGARSSAS